MKKLIYIFMTVLLTTALFSCTPEQVLQKTQDQACCGDDGSFPPPPPPPPPPGGDD